MSSVENTLGVPFSPLLSAQNAPEKTVDITIDPSNKERAATPGSDITTLNHALAKADALGQILSPKPFSETHRDERMLATQQLENSLNGVANIETRLTPEQKNTLQTEIDTLLNQLFPQSPQQAGKEYKGFYKYAVDKYTKYYDGLKKTISDGLKNWISPGKDSNSVIINVADMNEKLSSYLYYDSVRDIGKPYGSKLFPDSERVNPSKTVTESEAKQWAEGTRGTRVEYDPIYGHMVIIDPSPVKSMILDLGNLGNPAADGTLELDKAKLKPWLEGVNKQLDTVGYYMQNLAKRTVEDKVLWAKVATAIGLIGDNYLGVYEHVVAQYTDFFTSFSDVLSKMGGWINPGKDGNTVKLNITELGKALQALKSQYSLTNQGAVLFPEQDKGNGVKGATEGEAKQWASELGLPDTCVQKLADGTYVVVIDLKPIENMIGEASKLGTADKDGNVELDNAKFQAWQSGFKAQEENLKNTLQTLTQKYGNANSLYDNLVKVLSSTISSCVETAKSFLHG